MSERAEALARKFEAKAREATAVFQRLSDADWAKTTAAEKWSVGVTAHHIAVSHGLIAGLIKTVADGKPGSNIPMDTIHQMNAKHAQEQARCTKAETLALHERDAAAAAAVVRGLADAELDRRGKLVAEMPEMSVADWADRLLCGHVDQHLASIRDTVGA